MSEVDTIEIEPDEDETLEQYGDAAQQWQCECGGTSFEVFYLNSRYATMVRCMSCKTEARVHSG